MTARQEKIDVGGVLSRARKLAGVGSNADLARALGVSTQTVYAWKKRGSIPLAQLRRLAFGHDSSLEYLISGEPVDPNGPNDEQPLRIDSFGVLSALRFDRRFGVAEVSMTNNDVSRIVTSIIEFEKSQNSSDDSIIDVMRKFDEYLQSKHIRLIVETVIGVHGVRLVPQFPSDADQNELMDWNDLTEPDIK